MSSPCRSVSPSRKPRFPKVAQPPDNASLFAPFTPSHSSHLLSAAPPGLIGGGCDTQGCATRSAWLALGYTLPPLAGLRTSFVRTSRTSDISSRLFQRQRRVTYQPGPQGQEIGPKTAKRAEGPKHGHASRNELSDTFRGCGSAAPGYVLTPLRGCVAALCSQHEPRKEVTGHRDPASCGAPRVRTIPFAEMRSHDDRLNGLTTRRCNALMAYMPSWNTRRP